MSLPDLRSADPRGVFVEKPGADIYIVLLAISLAALIIGCIFLYGEMGTYGFDFKATTGR